ncbi:hypothetical protein AVEN_243907-1, partial [Araneus ventricosus]
MAREDIAGSRGKGGPTRCYRGILQLLAHQCTCFFVVLMEICQIGQLFCNFVLFTTILKSFKSEVGTHAA